MSVVDAVSERERFDRDGIARAVDVIAPADLAAMRACALARLATIELIEIAGARRPAPGQELALWALGREPAFAPLPAALAAALAQVFGPGVWAQVDGDLGGVALPNAPSPGARPGPCGVAWHTDEAIPPGAAAPLTVLAYACLAPVVAGGGATVVVTGSHRRLAALATATGAAIGHVDAPAALARVEPWFAALVERGDAERGCVSDGVPLGVAELTGAAGDVVFLDARCLHTVSANVASGPRLVMRLTCMAAAPA